ncbi:hypothetical protein BV20DRAFT_520392 [Pilatotrama ljubarskyi]|nr:hypothetical protein BV20DRAFT_520392 [Pilatotrama ljubarskyi]
MPEYTEAEACFHTVRRWYTDVQHRSPLHLQAIWADATVQERKKMRKSSPGGKGLVYMLNPDSSIKRGSQHAQRYVWPHDIAGRPRPSLNGLRLCGIDHTPRTLILDLGELHFQVQLLTHCTAQPYTRQQWDEEISQVSCIENARGFRVAIALDLGDYVLALLTLDLLWTPHWFDPQIQDVPIQHLDVYEDYTAFLAALAECVERAANVGFHKKTALATTAVRETYRRVFGGVGTYTVVELFFMAGLSVFLTEGELFACPSRLARLCEAFWAFAHRARTEIMYVIP